MRVKGEHLLQVLKHVVKESSTKAALLKAPPLPVHGLLVSLEVAIKVFLLVSLMGVKVVVLLLMLMTKRVKVFENVIKVEGLEVLFEVIVPAAAPSSSPVVLPR